MTCPVFIVLKLNISRSLSPNSVLVQRTIDVHYANRKRSSSLKWIVVNAFFLMIFVYDLWGKCPGHTTGAHYAQLAVAGGLACGVLHHALQLLPRRAAPLPLSARQLRLLGLAAPDLDSSFVLSDSIAKDVNSDLSAVSDAELSLSLSRAWRTSPTRTPPSPPSPRSSPPPPALATAARDLFIADRRSLADYLKQYEERAPGEPVAQGAAAAWAAPATPLPPAYQLAALDSESSQLDEGTPQGSPQMWWRLHLDPQRLTQWNFNLRLWIHVTILERMVRELRAAGLTGAPGLTAAQGLTGATGTLPPALLPYLEPFADKRYVIQRITELAAGGCLSSYRWSGGGSGWDDSKPTDAELVLHLLATYLDGQMPAASAGGTGGAGGAFSSVHLSAAPAPPPRGPRTLALHRVSLRPPHYALVLGDETLEVSRGRNNLLHSLLLLLAGAARRRPPALARTHLGPAGLNMLWIIGR